MTVLVTYASKHGATQGIAERIADKLRQMEKEVEVMPTGAVGDLAAYEALVIGSAVYSGSWLPEAAELVRTHSAVLAVRPVWLFSSGPLGAEVAEGVEQPKEEGEALGQIKIFGAKRTIHWPVPKEVVEFRGTIGPRGHEMFFGALDPKNLSFPERVALKAVGGMEGDFRDWDAIEEWAETIARELTPAGAAAGQA
ncbi:MAG TPA: flavodoxin domain-containing protein [Ktedonobacterales bacterium]|nr:flavodoxin domain-containing protein [Ktedonobacterales bacterium]